MNAKKKNILNVALTVLFVAALVVLMITASIGLPIYCRFFYYIQIYTLDLPARAASYGIEATAEQIREAYDGILDFCTLPGRRFQSGVFAMSEEGIAHFADCKALFTLNFWGMAGSGIVTLALIVLNKFKVIKFSRPFGRHAYLVAAVIAVALPLIIALIAVIVGFDAVFEAFHAIFFPGKDNWVFNPRYDQIITVMPEEFFMNCAIFIGCGLAAFSAALVIADVVTVHGEKKNGDNGDSKDDGKIIIKNSDSG